MAFLGIKTDPKTGETRSMTPIEIQCRHLRVIAGALKLDGHNYTAKDIEKCLDEIERLDQHRLNNE